MDEFLQDLSSVRWWLSVVLVGIIVGVLSTYARAGVDHSTRLTIGAISSLSRRVREYRTARLSALALSEHSRVFATLSEQRQRIRALDAHT
jgi:hypothetical protein